MRASLIVTAATSMTMHKTVGHPIAPSSKAGERRSLGRGRWVSFNVRKGWKATWRTCWKRVRSAPTQDVLDEVFSSLY